MALNRSESRQIAARYVEALFAVALTHKKQDVVGKDLSALQEVIAGSTELQKLIRNPMADDADKAAIFETILKKLGADAQTIQSVNFIIGHKRAEVLLDVAQLYSEKLVAHKGELSAEVITATPLSDAQHKAIIAELSKSAGQPVNVSLRVDASIMGGLIVKMGSKMLDHSVAGKLQRLKTQLVSQAA